MRCSAHSATGHMKITSDWCERLHKKAQLELELEKVLDYASKEEFEKTLEAY